MYVYEFEHIDYDIAGYQFIGGLASGINEFQSVIQRRAADGWRYAGYIPTKQDGRGCIDEIDLIFEKEVSDTAGE